MAQKYYKSFHIAGTAGALTLDEGIESTEKEPKKITAIIISVSDYKGNWVEGWIERERVAEIIDYVCNTHAHTGTTNTMYSTIKMIRFELGHDIKIGERFRAGIRCGPTATWVAGAYEYEIIAV